MASISVAEEVKWAWFILSLCSIAAYVISLAKTFKVAADSRSEAIAQVCPRNLLLLGF
jgi:bacteriorhodopsin